MNRKALLFLSAFIPTTTFLTTFPTFNENRFSNRKKFRYVILGSGTAAHAALETFKMGDPGTEILMISESEGTLLPRMDTRQNDESPDSTLLEQRLKNIYDEWRKQLSSGLGEASEHVSLIRASEVKIDLAEKLIQVGDNDIEYERCLLATAGKPRDFYVLERDKLAYRADTSINALHSSLDFKTLASVVHSEVPKHVTVVGGGYLGTEVVAALAESKTCKVTHVMGERTPLAQYLPQYLSEHITKKLISLGVEVRGEAIVTGLKLHSSPPTFTPGIDAETASTALKFHRSMSRNEQPHHDTDEKLTLNLVGADKTSIDTDYLVLASTNVEPDLMGLDDPIVGLEVLNGGIVVNSSLEAYRDFFVAGNAATYYDPAIGRRRVDTYDHAVVSGMWAAQNMLTSDHIDPYTYQPCFKSVLAGTGITLCGLGKIDAHLETVGVWFRPGFEGGSNPQHHHSTHSPPTNEEHQDYYQRGVVYYLEHGRVVGVLLCNANEMLDQAREVLRKPAVVTNHVELRKLILLAPSHWLNIVVTK